MGSPDPRAIARSKRGIAGSMIMTTFDRHCLGDFMAGSFFAAKRGSIENTTANPYKSAIPTTPAVLPTDVVQTLPPAQAAQVAGVPTVTEGIPGSLSVQAPPLFADQLLPFDSTLAAANEYGQGSMMRVFAIEILNEGAGISIDDTSNEVQMTYIARLVTPWIQQTVTVPTE